MVARLAVLIPAWNPGDRLRRTLASIAAQPTPCEVVVVDDGSDPPLDLPDRVGRHPLRLIRLAENQGIARALNAGLDHVFAAGFDYVARADCGDLDRTDRLDRQLRYLEAHPDVALVGSSAVFTDACGAARFVFRAPVGDAAIRRKMRYSAAVVHSTAMLRAAALQAAGAYSECYDCAEDYELFFRLAATHRIANLGETLVTADYNPAGISISRRRRSLWSRLRIQLRYFAFTSVHSYCGVLQTAALFALPFDLVARVKRRLAPAPLASP